MVFYIYIARSSLLPPMPQRSSRGAMGKSIRGAQAALIAAGLSLVFLNVSTAQTDYPSKVIKFIVPFPAGGPPDAIARVIAQHLHGRLGQSVIIENRPGGGTTIGTKAAVTANPDGYTLLFTGNN